MDAHPQYPHKYGIIAFEPSSCENEILLCITDLVFLVRHSTTIVDAGA